MVLNAAKSRTMRNECRLQWYTITYYPRCPAWPSLYCGKGETSINISPEDGLALENLEVESMLPFPGGYLDMLDMLLV